MAEPFVEDLDRNATGNDLRKLSINVDLRFTAVDRRFDAVDRRFDAVDRRFDEVDRRFNELRHDMNEGFNRIESRLARIPCQLPEIDNRPTELWHGQQRARRCRVSCLRVSMDNLCSADSQPLVTDDYWVEHFFSYSSFSESSIQRSSTLRSRLVPISFVTAPNPSNHMDTRIPFATR